MWEGLEILSSLPVRGAADSPLGLYRRRRSSELLLGNLNSSQNGAQGKQRAQGSPEAPLKRSSAHLQLPAQKPTSGKARKTQLQTNRAAKAHKAVPTPHPLDALELATRSANSTPLVLPSSSRPSGVQRFRTAEESSRESRKDASLKLESRFLRLPLDLLQHHRLISATAPLVRRKLW